MAEVMVLGAEHARQATDVPEPIEPVPDETLLAEDLLVEEISIDGMCGVY